MEKEILPLYTYNLAMGGKMYKEFGRNYSKEKTSKSNRNLWGIILAGGEGNRLKDFVTKLYGYHRPKQYCKIVHSKSLIKRTRERALSIIPNERLLTIINRQHLEYAEEEIGDHPAENIVIQPKNKETCAGLLLPLLNVYNRDPSSIVAVLPSDHFIHPEEHFMKYVEEAGEFVNRNPNAIVMLGIVPDRIESGYGWIERGDPVHQSTTKNFYKVLKFWEKPSPQTTEVLFASGCYLNTFVLIGRSEEFINYIRLYAPEIYNPFQKIRLNQNKQIEPLILEEIYNEIPAINFSTFVLEKITQHLHVLEVPDVYWSDWGEEQRILRDNERFGLGKIEMQTSRKNTQQAITRSGKFAHASKEILYTVK